MLISYYTCLLIVYVFKGQHIDTSLMETQLACLVPNASNFLTGGVDTMNRYGSGNSTIVPYQVFYCSDGNGLAIGIGSDKQFAWFCAALGLDDLLVDENATKYSTNANRVRNRSVLVPIIENQMKTKTRPEWELIFEQQSEEYNKLEGKSSAKSNSTTFPYGPLRKISEAFACEQAVSRDMTMNIKNTDGCDIQLVGHPVKYSRTPCTSPEDTLPPPLVGQHTDDILMNLCMYSSKDIESLRLLNVI